jgi:hypothetical protein
MRLGTRTFCLCTLWSDDNDNDKDEDVDSDPDEDKDINEAGEGKNNIKRAVARLK